jgi:hypothetical protein
LGAGRCEIGLLGGEMAAVAASVGPASINGCAGGAFRRARFCRCWQRLVAVVWRNLVSTFRQISFQRSLQTALRSAKSQIGVYYITQYFVDDSLNITSKS